MFKKYSRKGHIASLRQVESSQLVRYLQSWFSSAERDPARVIAEFPVTGKGEVAFRICGREMIIFGWTFFKNSKIRSVLITPRFSSEGKGIIITSREHQLWIERFYDPNERTFWQTVKGKRAGSRIYQARVPESHRFEFYGREILFPLDWKAGTLVTIWVKDKQITHVGKAGAGHNRPIRTACHEGSATQIEVGARFNPVMKGLVSGEVRGLRVKILNYVKNRRNKSFYFLFRDKMGFLTIEDLAQLGILAGQHVTVTFERGWPVSVHGKGDSCVNYRVVRNSVKQVVRSVRERIYTSFLPKVAIIENIALWKWSSSIVFWVGGKTYIAPMRHGFKPGMSIAVLVIDQRQVAYFSREPKFNESEWELVENLETVLVRIDGPVGEFAPVASKFITWVRRERGLGTLTAIGVRHLHDFLQAKLDPILTAPRTSRHRAQSPDESVLDQLRSDLRLLGTEIPRRP